MNTGLTQFDDDYNEESKYLGARIVTSAALTKLKCIKLDKNISFLIKIIPMRTLVISIILYVYKSWIIPAEPMRLIDAIEVRYYCKNLNILYRDHMTNELIWKKITTGDE